VTIRVDWLYQEKHSRYINYRWIQGHVVLRVARSSSRFGLAYFYMLPPKNTKEKKPLLDYNQLHIVTSNEYLEILRQKTLDKEATKIIKEQKEKCK